jgi:hypothetical protein
MSTITSPLVAAVQEFILAHYAPTNQVVDSLHLSTQEIAEKLEAFMPNFAMDHQDIAEWLHAQGFTFYDKGELRLVWLLKPL